MQPPLLLDTDVLTPDVVWENVRSALAAHRTVRLSGRLVATLQSRFAHKGPEGTWVSITPHQPPPEWFVRTRDILTASAALILLAPLLLLLAVVVKVSSPGPIFHTAVVVGRDRRRFVWRKFRSMRVVPETEDRTARQEQFRAFVDGTRQGKIVDRARITRTGAFLRKYSLDELPQFWNVFCGDMSLVGPRPCLPYEEELIPAWAAPRFQVRPGLTGIWQVAGRSRVSFHEALAMDVFYRYARTNRLDLVLVVQTVGVVLHGDGGE